MKQSNTSDVGVGDPPSGPPNSTSHGRPPNNIQQPTPTNPYPPTTFNHVHAGSLVHSSVHQYHPLPESLSGSGSQYNMTSYDSTPSYNTPSPYSTNHSPLPVKSSPPSSNTINNSTNGQYQGILGQINNPTNMVQQHTTVQENLLQDLHKQMT